VSAICARGRDPLARAHKSWHKAEMGADVIIEDERWSGIGFEALAEHAVVAALDHLGVESGDWDVVVLGAG